MKNLKNTFGIVSLFALFIILSLACATASKINYSKHYSYESFSIPNRYQIVTVSVGDTLLKQGTLIWSEAIKIKNDTLDGQVKKGTYLYDSVYKNDNKIYRPSYSSGAKLIPPREFLIYGPTKKQEGYKLVVKGNDLRTGSLDAYGSIVKYPQVIPETDYEFTKVIAAGEEDSFQQILIYTGRENNIVKFSYREFENDMARPAFTVDVQYDLNQSKIISFRQAKIEILEATNSSITYRVLENFN